MLNETGILKDRVFQPDMGLMMAKKELGPKSVWLPIVDDALKMCNQSIPPQIKHAIHQGCGHLAAYVVACLNTHLFKNCPKSIWNDSKSKPSCSVISISDFIFFL